MSELTQIMQEQKKALKVDGNLRKDKKCPFTGGLKVHGKTFTGVIVSKDTHQTCKVEWSSRKFIKKFERFMVRRTKVAAHNPEIINADVGDMVVIGECRPLSKTKRFVIIKNLGHSKEYMLKKEVIEADKKVTKERGTKTPEAPKTNDTKKESSEEALSESEQTNEVTEE